MKSSALSPCSVLRVLEAIRRNMTAAKERSYRATEAVSLQVSRENHLGKKERSREDEAASTEGSEAPAVCSARPINKISGRVAVQLFCKWSSAWVRIELSGDCKACKSWVSSAATSGGSTDMVEKVIGR
jgi:hypothetical protein